MLKIIFAGTPEFAAQHLIALIKSQYVISAVITKPDKPSGRGNKIIFSAVKTIAKKYNIPLLQPEKINKTVELSLYHFHADVMIVVAYGLIITETILKMFPIGCLNIHASLLPRWRGPSPIQSALLQGDTQTGITIINMDNKIDTGDIIYAMKCNILKTDNTITLTKKLIQLGIQSILITLEKISNNTFNYQKQKQCQATYSKKITKKHAKINWKNDAEILDRMIRAYNPWPISYFIMNNIQIKILEAKIIKKDITEKKSIGEIISIDCKGINIQTKKNIIQIKKIQFPGKKIITVKDFINAHKNWFKLGMILK
ncbi:Methionyl-tRNA formyltransferase [Buchnera aphidicola (Eriosoma grossulariae)]|uniref:methionyl-tRNA formyltransferase n=1 Tax=Buchnera aphidicola TaxID=9 RepID=UPI003463F976